MKFQSRRSRRRAFTLIELLIVLGILVMLLAFVGPRVLRSGEKADIKMATVQIGGFKGALDNYYYDMKTYPTTEQGLKALLREPEDLGEDSKWDGEYIDGDSIPEDPWGNPYQYEWPSTHGNKRFPNIWSCGPDGEDGTDDDICNWKKGSSESGDELDELDQLEDVDNIEDLESMEDNIEP
ncbi:MAG: type II secretion system major pseudopilin GspG [Pirellulales bacterium]|nr:type II secretion system major pseudopilin GspG [Pirellulales bacterium]